ncbi:hypothetical protein V6N12_062537 [Hibiscus sabdariffa]|uniref:Uncharacterized protein n=1 Tax=Hibiscus sabdariffa TaxID=183260 RepID=A0ABR2F961_9ROSI
MQRLHYQWVHGSRLLVSFMQRGGGAKLFLERSYEYGTDCSIDTLAPVELVPVCVGHVFTDPIRKSVVEIVDFDKKEVLLRDKQIVSEGMLPMYGISVHSSADQTFENITLLWGNFWWIDGETLGTISFERAQALIEMDRLYNKDELVNLEVEGDISEDVADEQEVEVQGKKMGFSTVNVHDENQVRIEDGDVWTSHNDGRVLQQADRVAVNAYHVVSNSRVAGPQ